MDQEIYDFLLRHLKSVQDNDIAAYHETTASDLTFYEWWVTPNRIDGLPFHEFMMTSNAQNGTVFGSDVNKKRRPALIFPIFAFSVMAIRRLPAIRC